jgi:hypothetical protein
MSTAGSWMKVSRTVMRVSSLFLRTLMAVSHVLLKVPGGLHTS